MAEELAYRVTGGRPLEGTVAVAGAKNAISKQLVASLLTEEPCVLRNVSRITEISVVLDMLSTIGASYEWLSPDSVRVHTPSIQSTAVAQKYSGFNRIPILLLGPVMHRAGEVTVPVVGGDKIGPRPVDFHIDALRAMGASIEIREDGYRASCRELRGTRIRLPYPSVGATENIIIAATLARGTTVIENAAVEPELIDTVLFLQKMGALIQVDVDRRIIVEGVPRLHGATHAAIPDRIEAASFAAAAVATDGRVTVRGARQDQMISFLNTLRKTGGEYSVNEEGITFFRSPGGLRGTHVETDVHPGFMTDWQQPFVILLTQARGVSVIHETVYEERFGYTQALREMGADIDLTTACLGNKPCRFLNRDHFHSCIVRGPAKLHSAQITIPDLRAGFAYLIAALVAEGTSELRGIRYIERGYADVPLKLRAIGASVDVVG